MFTLDFNLSEKERKSILNVTQSFFFFSPYNFLFKKVVAPCLAAGRGIENKTKPKKEDKTKQNSAVHTGLLHRFVEC